MYGREEQCSLLWKLSHLVSFLFASFNRTVNEFSFQTKGNWGFFQVLHDESLLLEFNGIWEAHTFSPTFSRSSTTPFLFNISILFYNVTIYIHRFRLSFFCSILWSFRFLPISFDCSAWEMQSCKNHPCTVDCLRHAPVLLETNKRNYKTTLTQKQFRVMFAYGNALIIQNACYDADEVAAFCA